MVAGMKLTITFTLPDTFTPEDIKTFKADLKNTAVQSVVRFFKDKGEKESLEMIGNMEVKKS